VTWKIKEMVMKVPIDNVVSYLKREGESNNPEPTSHASIL